MWYVKTLTTNLCSVCTFDLFFPFSKLVLEAGWFTSRLWVSWTC